MVSIDDLLKVLHELFKNSIIGPLIFNLRWRRSAILKIDITLFFCVGRSEVDESWQTGAE